MADEAEFEEAFRTAVGLVKAFLREDTSGEAALWEMSEDKDRVVRALMALASRAVVEAAENSEVTTDEWLDVEAALFEASSGDDEAKD